MAFLESKRAPVSEQPTTLPPHFKKISTLTEYAANLEKTALHELHPALGLYENYTIEFYGTSFDEWADIVESLGYIRTRDGPPSREDHTIVRIATFGHPTIPINMSAREHRVRPSYPSGTLVLWSGHEDQRQVTDPRYTGDLNFRAMADFLISLIPAIGARGLRLLGSPTFLNGKSCAEIVVAASDDQIAPSAEYNDQLIRFM